MRRKRCPLLSRAVLPWALTPRCQPVQVQVLAYEYPGYGVHPGPPSEARLYDTIREAYDFLRWEKQIPASHIVLCVSSWCAVGRLAPTLEQTQTGQQEGPPPEKQGKPKTLRGRPFEGLTCTAIVWGGVS